MSNWLDKCKLTKNEFMVATFFTFICGIYAPYEMYITNPGEFWFSLGTLLRYCITVSLCIEIVILLILGLVNNGVRTIVSLALFWTEICIYIQGTFLNIDIGQLTGVSFASGRYVTYYVRDAIIWIIVLLIIIFIYKKKKEVYSKITCYLPLFVMIVLIITGITLFIGSYPKEKAKNLTTKFSSVYGVSTLGDKDNIIVFVLDMFDSKYLDTILEDNPEIMDSFDGFTYYDNYVGGYATTAYSLAYMNSGKYFRNETLLDEFVNSQDSYVDTLFAQGYDVSNYGAYEFPGRLYKSFTNYIDGKVKVKSPIKFIIHIYEMGAFRYAPNICKIALINFHDKFSFDMTVDAEYKQYSDDNVDIAELFETTPMDVINGSFFKMIYAKGVHYPYENDENLNRVKSNEEYPVECAIGTLKMVDIYLDKMKKSGVYDNTTVIITADHGYFSDYGQNSISKPIMLIKQKNSHGELQRCSAPVSHEDFPATIADIATGEKINDFGKSIFAYEEDEIRERFYYHYYLKEKGDSRRLIEFKIANDSNSDNAFELSGKEYTIHGDVIDHVRFCKTCQTGEHFGRGECWHEKADDYPE